MQANGGKGANQAALRTPDVSTGIALIVIDKKGENIINVNSGAMLKAHIERFAVNGAKKITIHADGKNAARQAKGHIVNSTTKIEPTLSIDMARNGGFATIIE